MTLHIDVYIHVVDPSATVSLVRCYTTVYKTIYMNPMGSGALRGGQGSCCTPAPPLTTPLAIVPPIFWYKIAKY